MAMECVNGYMESISLAMASSSQTLTNYQRVHIQQHILYSKSLTHRIHGAGIYANMWGILMVNVTIYSSTMDPMGYCISQTVKLPFGPKDKQHFFMDLGGFNLPL